MRRLTFRQKLLITYAACALVLVFVTFASVSYYINSLQKQNVETAVEMAREQARQMAAAASEILAAQGHDNLDDPAVQASLRHVTRVNLMFNDSIIWGAWIKPDGQRLVEEFRNNSAVLQRDPETGVVTEMDLPSGNELKVEVFPMPEKTTDISMPVQMEGGKEGRIQLLVEQSDEYKSIAASSQRITRALLFICLLLLVFLLGVFFILWKMFFRQLELQQNNARLDRMAYVGTLASGLAHEIRNPLSSMNVNLEVIREELQELNSEVAQRAGELSHRVQKEVAQLNATLTSFLDFALPRKEGYSHFPLRGLVEELLEAHAEELKVHDIQLELEFPPSAQTVIEADRRLMHQAVRNVLVNAIQILTTSVKRVIRIRIRELPRDKIELSISDTGPGITEENLLKIFDVFFSTRKGGSGFGLAIARKIVEEHSGRLRAANNQESLGATFTMELPRMAQQEQTVQTGAFSRHGRTAGAVRKQ